MSWLRAAAAGVFCAVAVCAGCVSAPKKPAASPSVSQSAAPAAPVSGIYHTVERGQTLWRISRLYGVDLDEIVAANRIEDVTRIETGQKVLIPGAAVIKTPLAADHGEDFLRPMRGTPVVTLVPEYRGLNIAPRSGAGEVLASKSGNVVFVSDDFLDLGKTLIIDHHDGFLTVYGRLAEVTVASGEAVSRGSRIGTAGATRQDSRTYLHFQIRKQGIAQNPHLYLND